MHPIKKQNEIKLTKEMIKKEEGILPMFEIFYLESIKYAADRAVAAFKRFEDAIVKKESASLIIASIQEALTHTGTLSKFFWPIRDNGISYSRGKKLRKAFNLTEDSPLKNRDLRDTLEHFDEKLDIYLEQYPTGAVFPDPQIGPAAATTNKIMHVFRMVDTDMPAFVLLNKIYKFDQLQNLTTEILKKVEKMIKDGGRLQSKDLEI